MLRRFVCASVVLVIGLGVVMAEEFQATIYKVDGNKVTFKKGAGKKATADAAEMTLPATKDAKITKGKFDQDAKKLVAGDAIENGLKNEMFTKIEEGKGVVATITTDADNKNITAITTGGKGGKGKGKKNAN